MLTLPDSHGVLSIRARAFVFEDPRSRALLARIERIGHSQAPVLITGETGTGKELVARALHAASARAARRFVAVNAGAFSEQLIEAELFGHEKGAFTGAHAAKAGWFETAHGGTLFLDEIGDLPLALQVKLLRVLQEGEVTRLGSRQPIAVDVRLIAATNVDLSAAIRDKRFREDLYYRLKVASLSVPPLRERTGDILPLARHFLLGQAQTHTAKQGRPLVTLSASAEQALLRHSWPGNIRELENALHHALLVHEGGQITREDLPFGEATALPAHAAAGCEHAELPGVPAQPELAELERVLTALLDRKLPNLHERVQAALLSTTYQYTGGNQLETARLLGMSRNVVRARLIECGSLRGPLRRSAAVPPIRRQPLAAGPVLRIGYQKLGLLMLVKAYGAFDAVLAARGVRVEWSEYAGGIQLVEALRRRELAACVLGDAPAVLAQAQDVPVVYLAAEPPAPQGTALIVPESSSVRDVRGLVGKRIAVNRASQAHYLLLRALEEAGVDLDEVTICIEPPERALRAFQRGEIDAWSVWDPWLSSACIDHRARVLRDATGLMPSATYYVAEREIAEHSPELFVELLQHVETASQWVMRDARAADMIAPALGLSPRALRASLARELGTLPLTAEKLAAQQHIADGLLARRMLARPVTVAEAQWQRALAAG